MAVAMTSAVHNEVCRKGVPVQRAQTHTATMLGPASPVPDPNNPSAYLHRDLSRLPSRGHHGTYVQSVHMTGPRLHDFRRGHLDNRRNKGHHATIVTHHPPHRHPLVPLQDRRALVCRSFDDIKRGPSPDYPPSKAPWRNVDSGEVTHYRERPYRLSGALHTSQSEWSVGSGAGRDSPPAWDAMNTTQQSLDESTNSLFSLRSTRRDLERSRPMSPSEGAGLSMDSLYKSGKPPPKVPPSKHNVHNAQCYASHVRPWRHDLWTGSNPSPAAPRESWRETTKGVLRPKPSKTASKRASLKPTSEFKAGNPALAGILSTRLTAADTSSTAEGGLRRFAIQQQAARKRKTKFPKLGVSASMLRKFLDDHAEALRGDLEHEEKVSKIFSHFDKDGDGVLNEAELACFKAALQDDDAEDDWYARWKAAAGIQRRYNKLSKTYYEDDVAPEQFAMIYSTEDPDASEDSHAPPSFRHDKLERDLSITLLCTTAVINNIIKPATAEDQCSLAEVYRQGRDESGQRLIGKASIFVSYAGAQRFSDLCETTLGYMQLLQPVDSVENGGEPGSTEGEQEEQKYVFIDAFCLNQHASETSDLHSAMTYVNAIGTMDEVIMLLGEWDDSQPLQRSWCLWEFLAAELQSVPFSIRMTDPQRARFVTAVLENFGDVKDKLLGIDVSRASTGNTLHHSMLHDAIRKTVGYMEMDNILTTKLRAWLLDEARTSLAGLSEEDYGTASLPVLVAKLLSDMGEYDEALVLFRRISQALTQKHGDEDARSLDSMSDVATCLLHRSKALASNADADFEAAQAGLMEAEKIATAVHETQLVRVGKVDPASLTAAYNRAAVLIGMYIFASERGTLAPLDSALFRNTRTPLEKVALPDRWLVQAERLLENYYEIISKWQRQGRGGDTTMRELACLVQTAQSQHASGSNRITDAEGTMRQALNLSRRSKDIPHVRTPLPPHPPTPRQCHDGSQSLVW